MTVDLRNIGDIATGQAPDDALLTVKYARLKDSRGFPTVEGEKLRLCGEDWLIPRRKADTTVKFANGRAECDEMPLAGEEWDLVQQIRNSMYVDGLGEMRVDIAAGFSFLAHVLRLNYEISDGVMTKIINDDLRASKDAVTAALDIRLVPAERADLCAELVAWIKRQAEENPLEVAEAIEVTETDDGD